LNKLLSQKKKSKKIRLIRVIRVPAFYILQPAETVF